MENASKALLIAAGILIALLVISIGVYLFANYRNLGSSYEQTLQTSQKQRFNVNFTKLEGRNDITIHEIVSLANYVREYNKNYNTNIKVILLSEDLTDPTKDLTAKIKEINTDIKYKAIISGYEDGMVQGIIFLKEVGVIPPGG